MIAGLGLAINLEFQKSGRIDVKWVYFDPRSKVLKEKVSGAPESFLYPRPIACDHDLRLLAKFSHGGRNRIFAEAK